MTTKENGVAIKREGDMGVGNGEGWRNLGRESMGKA